MSLDQGTGFSAAWVLGDAPFGVALGDTFDEYAAQDPITETLDDGVGLGTWIHGNSPFGNYLGDSFDTYAAQDPITESLDDGDEIGTWIFGDGP